MVKKTTKAPATKNKGFDANLLSHPATTAMIARVGHCNKPPIMWRKDGDTWLECFLRPDCTYGNCHEVDASDVPPEIRNA
jgi:hypothetical protein